MPRVLPFFRIGLREKPRVALAVGFAVFAATALYTFTRPKIYEATASVPIGRILGIVPRHPNAGKQAESLGITCGYDLGLFLKVGNSRLIAQKVADRIDSADLHHLGTSEATSSSITNHEAITQTLLKHRHISGSGDIHTVHLHCTVRLHAPVTAARLADLYAATIRDYFQAQRATENEFLIEDLKPRAEKQREKIAQLEAMPSSYSTEREIAMGLMPGSYSMEREIAINRELLRQLEARIQEIATELSGLGVPIIPAEVPAPDDYVEPNIPLHLATGLLAGLALGPLASALAARRESTANPT